MAESSMIVPDSAIDSLRGRIIVACRINGGIIVAESSLLRDPSSVSIDVYVVPATDLAAPSQVSSAHLLTHVRFGCFRVFFGSQCAGALNKACDAAGRRDKVKVLVQVKHPPL